MTNVYHINKKRKPRKVENESFDDRLKRIRASLKKINEKMNELKN